MEYGPPPQRQVSEMAVSVGNPHRQRLAGDVLAYPPALCVVVVAGARRAEFDARKVLTGFLSHSIIR